MYLPSLCLYVLRQRRTLTASPPAGPLEIGRCQFSLRISLLAIPPHILLAQVGNMHGSLSSHNYPNCENGNKAIFLDMLLEMTRRQRFSVS